MPKSRHLRASIAGFVLVAVGAVAFVGLAQPGDAEISAGVDVTSTTASTDPAAEGQPAPADAEQVLDEAQRQAEEAAAAAAAAEQAEAQRLADEEAALRALAEAEAAARAEELAAAEAATAALRQSQVGVPADDYWDRMAYCETGGNWGMTGSRYSGGVGFYNGTWDAWGGREFANLAGHATREQQIIVANRVATQGYQGPRGYVAPVGYSGWGCVKTVGYP
jgi:membrane protein involved in colicin uptake